ncbi:hypothetical protein F4779DRAFT_607605 [Xylariaceae sp. FL0662B]|nr:hypothetical protein F4779DRAFT_607605 [Xylariaceae sp. FL0662B]
MPAERIIIDGLYRCLCPSVDLITLCKAFGSPRRHRPPPTLQTPPGQCRREYRRIAYGPDSQPDRKTSEQARVEYLMRLAKRSPWVPEALFEGTDSFITKLDRIPTRSIYAALRELPGVAGTYFSVVKLVEYLIKERDEKPNANIYESLMRANVDKRHGSAEVAAQLFKEMEKLGIPATPQIYQALLEVTAIHPDYVLRSSVLFEMKNRWYLPTANDLVNITIGLLRDNQYELALEKLEEMHKSLVPVPPWLYEIFFYTFGELGFHEETLAILKYRLKLANVKKSPLSLNAWQFLLDVYSRDGFYDGIKYIWARSVSPGYLNPSDGVVTNILNAASRHVDAALAISAIQTLSSRGRKLGLHHYEALTHIYAQQGDLRKALTTLCIMTKAGLTPDLSSTRSIFRMLRASPSETNTALGILNDLRLQYEVPSAAFNVVLEVTEIHRGFKVALDLYRSVRDICANGPDLETYHILLRHCTFRKSMNFLFAEMESFSIEPIKTTYDHLIRIASMQEDYKQAFHFLERMKSAKTAGLPNNWWLSKDSALALIRRCIQAEDIRVQELIKECRSRKMSIDAEVQRLARAVQKKKESEESADSVGLDVSANAEGASPVRSLLPRIL